jgi:hypothetical protein
MVATLPNFRLVHGGGREVLADIAERMNRVLLL